MSKFKILLILITFCLYFLSSYTKANNEIVDRIEVSLKTELLDIWYPLCLDLDHGGFLSDFSYDWKEDGNHDKMLVTQARHLWTTSETALYFKDNRFNKWATHGFKFLKEKMWDTEYGGFFNRLDRKGNVQNDGHKSAYGNAFVIYGLSSYFKLSGDSSALDLAKKTFLWLEKNSHDPECKGYYNNMNRDGLIPASTRFGQPDQKDQNSSIHLLEAFTNLYQVWPDSLLHERLLEMLVLIRDTITTEKGYLTLFMQRDWTPISLQDVSEEEYRRQYFIDHVSFGHDLETAFLMLEASHVTGLKSNSTTLIKAKKMVDHALANGWDRNKSGFFDAGYYFKDSDTCIIVNAKKIWWTQAEGLNALLLMSKLFPDETKYSQAFNRQWQYINLYMIDHEYGGWYGEGLDCSPKYNRRKKGYDWKGNYHNFRAMLNCVKMLNNEFELLNEETK